MSLMRGFQQTDIGQLPADWEVVSLGKCLSEKPKYGINAAAVPYSNKFPVYIRITDISVDGRFAPDKVVSVRGDRVDQYYLQPGDLVFARTGASVGKSYMYDPKDGQLVFAGFLIRVRPNPHVLESAFLAAYVTTGLYWNWVRLMSMRSGQPGINGIEYSQLPIPLPPLPEQRAIAVALGDVDGLIGALDRLIAKKRDLKQAAMQQLLTGQTRLPGFSGDWDARQLGDLGQFSKGKGIRKDDVVPDGLPCIRYGEIYTAHHDYVRSLHSHISPQVAQGSQRLKKGDLLFAGSGETAEEIGKCVAFLHEVEAYAGGDIVIFTPRGQDSMFFGYLMNHSSIVSQKAALGQGDAVVHISATNLAALQLLVPSREEQAAIASVLIDTDAELAALEARRDKTRALKQGMMQELLTGRTRLI